MAAGFGKYGKIDEENKRLSESIDFAGFCFTCSVSGNDIDIKKECLNVSTSDLYFRLNYYQEW